MLIKKFN